jgi:hypothetical protein
MGMTQEKEYVANGDTIRYNYTPLPSPSLTIKSTSESAADSVKRPRNKLLQRFIDFATKDAVDRTFEKKIDFSVVPGPTYSSKTSLSLGVIATGAYRVNRRDSITSPSNVSLYATVSIIGYYYLGVMGQTFFSHNRHRLFYDIGFQSMPTDFWGFGYRAATTNPKSGYVNKNVFGEVKYLYEIFRNFNVGALLDFRYTKAKGVKAPEYFGSQRYSYITFGQGAIVEYDSRDVITNPTRGLYAGANFLIRPKFLSDAGHTLWRTRATINYYQRLWRDAVLAFDLHGEFNSRHTPWTLYALLGSNYRMRGYYEGRFSDLNMVTFQVELRQRVWRRLGVVVWGGAGNVFHSFDSFEWRQTLPNYGVGLRWELTKGINARIDYGLGGMVNGRLINGLVMSINEAF